MTKFTKPTVAACGITYRAEERALKGGGGVWVRGSVAGFRFDALVFSEHAESEGFEYGASRISKLWVTAGEGRDRKCVFNFDRGLDVDASSPEAQAAVALVAGNLAALVFGK